MGRLVQVQRRLGGIVGALPTNVFAAEAEVTDRDLTLHGEVVH